MFWFIINGFWNKLIKFFLIFSLCIWMICFGNSWGIGIDIDIGICLDDVWIILELLFVFILFNFVFWCDVFVLVGNGI